MALGSRAKNREKVYSIDPQTDLDIRKKFIENISRARLDDYVVTDNRNSGDAVKDFNADIRLLFIDGSHVYNDVKQDILLWKRFLVDGGIIALHDYTHAQHPCHCPDVKKAVDEIIFNTDEFIVEGCIDSILFASLRHSQNRQIFDCFNKFNRIRNMLKKMADKSLLK